MCLYYSAVFWTEFTLSSWIRTEVVGYMLCLVVQSCPTFCNPSDCSPPGSFVHGDSPGKNIGVGCHVLLQGISPTQGLNTGLLHHRQILCHLSHQGSPRILEWLAYPFCGLSQPRNWTRVSCIAGGFFTNWAIREVCCLCTICVKSIINLLLHSAI